MKPEFGVAGGVQGKAERPSRPPFKEITFEALKRRQNELATACLNPGDVSQILANDIVILFRSIVVRQVRKIWVATRHLLGSE
jgi:hypothetical protein